MNLKSIIKKTAVASILILYGCAPTMTNLKNSKSDDPSQESLAVVNNWLGLASTFIYAIEEIDENRKILIYRAERDGDVSTFKLKPGHYKITLSNFRFNILSPFYDTYEIELKAGHRYKIDSEFNPKNIYIIDENTSLIIAGKKA